MKSYQFIAVRLPLAVKQADEEDAKAFFDFIQPDVSLRVNINLMAQGQVLSEVVEISDFNKGNIKARQRMTISICRSRSKESRELY